MNTRHAATFITFLATTQTAGCYSTWDIQPAALRSLHGFRSGKELQLATSDGEVIAFDEGTSLEISGTRGVPRQMIRYRTIDIDFENDILRATRKDNGQVVNINLWQAQSVRAEKFSGGKTAALVTGLGLGTAAIAGGAFFVLLLQAAAGIGGRPLHITGNDAPVRADVFLDPTAPPSLRDKRADLSTRAQIMKHWAQEASAECASIPAFLALARDLHLVGAPTSLVEQAFQAAREEAIHTQLCTALATKHAPGAMIAQTPPTPIHRDIDRQTLLKRLALEAFWDGCIAEGLAANVAQRSIPFAKHGETQEALQIIARDESQHAEFSRQILAYCLSAGGRVVRNAVVERFQEKRAAEEALVDHDASSDEPAYDVDLACEYGLASDVVRRNARAEIWEKSVRGMGLT